ncbi:CMRF35-like molecule 1 [Ailuropoda melanoleuca]|uniref:CMRF35-like molecule 1 n=1 Tax=Ailuropoda melanoleuca TaxID=9646 RepID=A0A7N5JYU1_AILME|nr:CMRF35-like molecule 1 [Ailuropoda melanoleuca]XP_034508995.1 CMRF35-like molecule 1 [Ailuropoda melanoleuca]
MSQSVSSEESEPGLISLILEANSPLFFQISLPQTWEPCESRDGLSNSDCSCLLAAGTSPEQVLQPPEGDLCYANLALQSTGTSHDPSQRKACTKPTSSALDDQREVEYVTMAPFPKEDISYAALSWELLNQEPTYCNMNYHVARVPSRSHEESMEYSSIRRP